MAGILEESHDSVRLSSGLPNMGRRMVLLVPSLKIIVTNYAKQKIFHKTLVKTTEWSDPYKKLGILISSLILDEGITCIPLPLDSIVLYNP